MRNAEVIRQWQILREVEAHRTGVTIHDLATRVRVSTRTIRRDLQALQEAGFALYDEGDRNETKRWKLEAQPFRGLEEGLTVQDVAALYLSRSIVDSLPGWPLARELADALGKLERALNPRTREFLATLPQVITAKAGPRGGRVTARLVEVTQRLLDAVRDRHEIEMRYFSAASNRAKSYRVQPCRLTLAHGGVYLAAWVPQYSAFRTFAADRIERLTLTGETFRQTHQLPADLFASSLGVFMGGEPEHIEIEFESHLVPHIRGRIWHDSQETTDLPGGRIRLTLHVSNDWALKNWILGFGAAARVVKPRALADAIREELQLAAARY